MATFRKRNGKWQVQVRRMAHGSLSRTFTLKTDAQTWAHRAEAEDRQALQCAKKDSHRHNRAVADPSAGMKLCDAPPSACLRQENGAFRRLSLDAWAETSDLAGGSGLAPSAGAPGAAVRFECGMPVRVRAGTGVPWLKAMRSSR